MDVIKFGFRYWKRNLALSILAKLMSGLALTADLLLPMITALFVDYVIKDSKIQQDNIFSFMLSGKYGAPHTMNLFWHLAILFGTLLLTKLILVYVKNILNQKLGLRMETDMRIATFHKLMTLDSATISQYNTGELLTTLSSDTIMFKDMFCRIIPNIFDSIFVLIVAVILLATINLYLLIIPVIMIPIFFAALVKFKKKAMLNFREIRQRNSEMNLTVQENIEAVRLVRSFTNEEQERSKFDHSNDQLKDAYVKQVKLSANFDAVFKCIIQFAYIGSIGVSALLVMKGYVRVGFLVACADYILKIMNYITMINNMIFQMQQQLVSGQKMMNFMACESRIPDGTKEISSTEKPDINFNHVTIELDDQKILDDICLSIPAGKKIGVVGGTGSGKSVLLESLIRIHDATGGSITINGVDIKDCRLESLRSQFAYVFQDVFLFSNTIESNIDYADPEADEETMYRCALHAQADSFIQQLDDGYETIVGERGLGISGGQKQRVSIARALLKNSPVLILDDSTSALDMDTEKKLLASIKEHYNDKTLIISAHRMTSVMDCDEIIYLSEGKIVERGTFDELMKLDGHFAKVYHTQEAQKASVVDFDHIEGGETLG